MMRAAAVAILVLAAVAAVSAKSPRSPRNGHRTAARILAHTSIAHIQQGFQEDRFTCEQLIQEQLRRIDAYNPRLRAFIFVNREQALEQARRKDAADVLTGPLHCVPVAVKDNIDVQGVPTTNGAAALRGMVAAEDSAVVASIRRAGGIIIGKTNMAEMSDSGTKSESTTGGVCSNPWDPRRSCLGSSGGSGAAVAAGLAVVAIGTDTEGSVIGPCTASGLFCMRPTQGGIFEKIKVGVYPAFERQDLLGIMAKTRGDYFTAHDAIYGSRFEATAGNVRNLNGTKIRFLDNFYDTFPLGPGMTYSPDPEIVRLHNQAAQHFADIGARVQRYKASMQEIGPKFQRIVSATETKVNCSNSCMKKSLDKYFLSYSRVGPFRKARDLLSVIRGFPASYQAKLNFTLGQADADVCGSVACGAYEKARVQISQILHELFGDAQVLAVPYGANLPQLHTEEPGIPDQITVALNPYSGWPSVALPVGFTVSRDANQPLGMPVSLVLVAREPFQESLLLGVANAYLKRFPRSLTPAATPALE